MPANPSGSLDKRNPALYSLIVIKTFLHKGLKVFFDTGSKAGIQPHHASKLKRQLIRLNVAKNPSYMNMPGWRLHQLSTRQWSVWVNGNWRIIFEFEGENALLVDYQDYH